MQLFGGSIEPLFEVPPPKWLTESRSHFATMFVGHALPDGPVTPGAIYGANMAARISVIKRGFRFDERLGPDTRNPHYPSGGETEFCKRVARSGARCWFASEPSVQHIVRPFQFTRTAWARRAYRLGCARAIEMWEKKGPVEFRDPSWGTRISGLCHRVQAQIAMFSPVPRQRFDKIVAYHIARGFRDEWARQERHFRDTSRNRWMTFRLRFVLP